MEEPARVRVVSYEEIRRALCALASRKESASGEWVLLLEERAGSDI